MWYIENRNNTTFNIFWDCNQVCPFCSGYPKINFKKEDIQKKIHGLKEISLQWWEPTLSPYLFEILDYARSHGTEYINLITNGFKIADFDFAKKLVGKVDCYHFAFMSHKWHKADDMWGSEDTLKLKIKGILNLIQLWEAHKIRLVHIIQNKNIEDLSEFPIFVKKRLPGVSLIEFKYIQYFGNKNNLWNIPLYTEAYNRLNKAFWICNKLWIRLLINGIPLCFIDKKFHQYTASFYNKNTEEDMKNYATMKFGKCHSCKDTTKCIGVRKDYIMLHWAHEFK